MARKPSIGDPIAITTGPFLGVFDSSDPGESTSRRLFDALNMFAPDATNGSAMVARHGMQGLTAQVGTTMARTGQRFFLHRRLNGVIDRFVFGGGRMYRWNGVSTLTDITPANVFIDSENPVFCASYNGALIVSDENNKPWVYDPTTATATLIDLDGTGTEWSTKGGPAIYAGKVWFIVRALGSSQLDTETSSALETEAGDPLETELISGAQNTAVWCEELTPLVGYVQSGFNNSWVLTQTSGEVLGCLSAEEGALVYFRNVGIGYITGEINTDFQASATRDTISTTIGTDAPAAVYSLNRKIWFADLDGRIFRAVVGGGEPEQLWFPVRREITEHIGTVANRANVAANARVAFHSGYNLMLFTIWDRQVVYAFDAASGQFVGNWSIGGDLGSGISIDAMGSTIDASNRATFVVLGSRGSVASTATSGVMWRQKHADDAMQWLDQPDETVESYIPLVRAVESHWLGSTAAAAYRLREVVTELLGDRQRHPVGLEYVVPASGKSKRVVAQSTATVGEKSASDSIAVARWSLGPNAQGTSARLRVSATHRDNVRWGVNTITATGVVTKARPNAT